MEAAATDSPRTSRKNSKEHRNSISREQRSSGSREQRNSGSRRNSVTRKSLEKKTDRIWETANVLRATVRFSSLRSGLGECDGG